MDEKTPQIVVALTFLFLGIFILVDQVSIYMNLDITSIVRPIFILAGVFAVIAGILLLLELRG